MPVALQSGALQLTGAAACLANLGLIASLPSVLFKPGKKHVAWWTTAAPLISAGVGIVVGVWVAWSTWAVFGSTGTVPTVLGVALTVGSAGLIAWAGASHRHRFALWHQDDDAAVELVTWGPYRFVRHPLYSAFLLTLAACALVSPNLFTVFGLVGGCVQLNRTAAREENRLSSGPLGEQYRAYAKSVGRFWPRARTAAGPPPRPCDQPTNEMDRRQD